MHSSSSMTNMVLPVGEVDTVSLRMSTNSATSLYASSVPTIGERFILRPRPDNPLILQPSLNFKSSLCLRRERLRWELFPHRWFMSRQHAYIRCYQNKSAKKRRFHDRKIRTFTFIEDRGEIKKILTDLTHRTRAFTIYRPQIPDRHACAYPGMALTGGAGSKADSRHNVLESFFN